MNLIDDICRNLRPMFTIGLRSQRYESMELPLERQQMPRPFVAQTYPNYQKQ